MWVPAKTGPRLKSGSAGLPQPKSAIAMRKNRISFSSHSRVAGIVSWEALRLSRDVKNQVSCPATALYRRSRAHFLCTGKELTVERPNSPVSFARHRHPGLNSIKTQPFEMINANIVAQISTLSPRAHNVAERPLVPEPIFNRSDPLLAAAGL